MTRNEFMETITTWGDLLQFCYDNGLDACSDIVDADTRDEYVNNWLSEWSPSRYEKWNDVWYVLDNIPTSDDGYFLCEGSTDFTELDDYDDFEAYKRDVLTEAEESDLFEEENEEPEEDLDDDENDDEWESSELSTECSLFSGFTGTLIESIQAVIEDTAQNEEYGDVAFDAYDEFFGDLNPSFEKPTAEDEKDTPFECDNINTLLVF